MSSLWDVNPALLAEEIIEALREGTFEQIEFYEEYGIDAEANSAHEFLTQVLTILQSTSEQAPQVTPTDEPSNLRKKQLDADQAWEYLQSKGVTNLDIERTGRDKVTLVELLAEFANGVYIGRDETDYEEVADKVREYAESWAGQPHSADPWPWDNFQVGRIIQWAVAGIPRLDGTPEQAPQEREKP